MTKPTRRGVLATPLAALLPAPAVAQPAWPDRPVRMVVPNPPGGSTDVLTRILSAELARRLGQPFPVENRPGAGGNVGVDAVAKATPDGGMVISATVSQYGINPFLYRTMPFDAQKDLAFVSLTWDMANVCAVPAQHVQATALAAFVTEGKARGGGLAYGTPGIGTTAHLLGELFGRHFGIPVTHVPFRGAAEAIPAMLRGDTQYAIDNLVSYLGVVRSGQVRLLATTAEARMAIIPEVPTFRELGLEDFALMSWAAFAMPAGTPRPIVEKLSATLREIGADPEVRRRFADNAAILRGSSPEAVTQRLDAERPRWQALVRLSGARAE